MQQITINESEAGGRLDKFLHRFMPKAPSSFFYKMLRKKNITLNNKKAEGKEILSAGDVVNLYLSDETISNFQAGKKVSGTEFEEAYRQLKGIQVVYEDEHVLILDKPAGILSQKAAPEDISLNEWLVGYLLSEKEVPDNTRREALNMDRYRPSICNRLDRNTAGLVICAKTSAGSREMNRLIRSREVKKFYQLMVKGEVWQEETLEGYLLKDAVSNTVHLVNKSEDEAAYIKTRYYPVKQFQDMTLVEAELITGRSHQIRVHMAGIGHPVLGDYKYGNRSFNDYYKKNFQINSQLLWACRLEFPELKAPFQALSKRKIEGSMPKTFKRLCETRKA